MATVLAWLDGDTRHRQRMVDMLNAMGEKTALDELGFGTIRDTFADALFPATSTQHTHIRYLLFIPWMFRHIAADPSLNRRAKKDDRAARDVLADVNMKLVEALKQGQNYESRSSADRTGGIIGAQAGRALRLLPSSIYWSAMNTLQIHEGPETSPIRLLHRVMDTRAASTRRRFSEETDETDRLSDGLAWTLPPAPGDFLRADAPLTFELTRDEAEFLAGRFQRAEPLQDRPVLEQSMTAWCIRDHGCNTTGAQYPWEPELLEAAPDDIRRVLVHARDFNLLTRGAAAQYNVQLTEALADQTGSGPHVERAHEDLDRWLVKASAHGVLWDRDAGHQDFTDFRDLVLSLNPRVARTTLDFVERWLDTARLATARHSTTDNPPARDLLAAREAALKGRRARLTHAAAREARTGMMGTDYDFRWSVAHQYLDDIHSGLDAADA
ncbi:MAG: DUF6361 family protein [Acidipropionibacterium acidipropionici]|jgi:hypothetical protein|uniref:Uncharacterized protein n=1 Tax=Acidipropionibacterium acidipropionici (strain ATCC 4875 / DSM 20272 / JCM 6432 / NBRC 12425 / NCIMB 8070 / 4) TaxID=1171373 RepID=K7RYM2_ACIA4|nr:DUF6361 family protein [Acidipropionibacterium acidipropionici]AFV90118.1 hypothetical protein PACID_23390 [Acidipropionibacterium acidipropionici ATCC 4875]